MNGFELMPKQQLVGVLNTKGEKGDPGYTPQRGIDYYTEADKAEMVDAVLEALPTWEGGDY